MGDREFIISALLPHPPLSSHCLTHPYMLPKQTQRLPYIHLDQILMISHPLCSLRLGMHFSAVTKFTSHHPLPHLLHLLLLMTLNPICVSLLTPSTLTSIMVVMNSPQEKPVKQLPFTASKSTLASRPHLPNHHHPAGCLSHLATFSTAQSFLICHIQNESRVKRIESLNSAQLCQWHLSMQASLLDYHS